MLSTSQNIREQEQSLTETINSHLSTISQEIKAAIQKSEKGDSTVDADQLTTRLINNLINDLLKLKKVNVKEIDVEFGSSFSFGRRPEEHKDRIEQVKLSEEDQIMANVEEQYQEAKQVIAELFDIYQQTVQNFTLDLKEKKNQLKLSEQNSLKSKCEQSQDLMIKSQSKLISQGSDFQLTILSSPYDSLKKFIQKQIEDVHKNIERRTQYMQNFLKDLQEISELTIAQLCDIQKPSPSLDQVQEKQSEMKIFISETEPVFQSYYETNNSHPTQCEIDELKKFDGRVLPGIVGRIFQLNTLNKIWYSRLQTVLGYSDIWNFGFYKDLYCSEEEDQILRSFNLDQQKNPIQKISFYRSRGSLSGLVFYGKNGKIILPVGDTRNFEKQIVLEDGQMIIGVAAHEQQFGGGLTDFKFLLAKFEQN